MTITISRLYDDYQTASRAVNDLESAGVPHSEISIVASNADSWYADQTAGRTASANMTTSSVGTGNVGSVRHDRDRDGVDDRAEGAGTGAGIGAVLGGTAGLLAGLGMLAIPGVGPVVAAGWLASTALGAVAGGATGGAIGALTEAGISHEDAPVYAEGVRRGGAIVSARIPDADRSRLEAILDRSAVDIRSRGDAYRKSGWTKFDEAAAPYTADQVRSERDLYRRAPANV